MSLDDFFGAPASAEQMPDVMIDLETMGTRPNSPIIAIGAVTFDSRKLQLGQRYYANVNLASSVALGSVIDPDTVIWWMRQSDDARKALTQGRQYDISSTLVGFGEWLQQHCVEHKGRKVWANSPAFDCVILGEHYRKSLLEVPWVFSNERDWRTLRNLYPNVELDQGSSGTHHNALDDAIYQVEHLFKIRRTLRGNA